MEPRELLQELMRVAKLNPTTLAAKVQNRTTQPQIHKFIKGTAKEPRRTTLQPVAEFFGVPVEAFYDSAVAERIARAKGLTTGSKGAAVQTTLMELTPEQVQLLQDFVDMAPSRAVWFRNAIREAAEEGREIRADEASKPVKATDKTAAARKSPGKSSTSLRYGDGNRRQMPLMPVLDPFNATPNEREVALYHRIQKAPKDPHGESARTTERKPK